MGHGHGDGASVLVTTQCDDHAAFAVADALAVQSQAAGQQSRMGLQEGGESVCIGHRVDSSQQVVERVVAGHSEPPAVLVAHAESEGLPLVLGQTGHFAPKVEHVARPHEQAQRDQPQHGRERVPPAGGGTRIGHLPKGLPQVFELGDFERAASTAALTLGGLAGLG